MWSRVKAGRGRDQLAAFEGFDPGHIIGHQAVAALDQAQDRFAFPDAALAANQNADAEDIDHAAELRHGGREIHFHRDRGRVDEAHRDHGSAEDGDLFLLRDREEGGIEVRAARDDQAGNFLPAKAAETLGAGPRRETIEIRLLGRAQDLDAFFGEVIVEAGEGETGAVDGGLADFSMKADAIALQLQLQCFGVRLIETFHGDDRHAFPQRTAGSDGLHGGVRRRHDMINSGSWAPGNYFGTGVASTPDAGFRFVRSHKR